MTSVYALPKPKTWWTKRVLSDSYHCAGRLNDRQVKFAAESGFSTVASVFTYPEEGDGRLEKEAGRRLPTTDQTSEILSAFDDVNFAVILNADEDWKTEKAVVKVVAVCRSRPKPILLYCHNSYVSAFLLLAYYAYVTSRHDNNEDEPELSDKDVFRIGAALGYNFGGDPDLTNLVGKLTGNQSPPRTPFPDTVVENWYDIYWPVKPIYRNWFACGQFQCDHVSKLAEIGFKTIINNRMGKPDPGENRKPEDVSLLNISGGVDARGDWTNFLSKRISKTRPQSYVSEWAPINFEFINPLEFGDVDGYNEGTERRHLSKFLFSARYWHIPTDMNDGCTPLVWSRFQELMKNHSDKGPHLVHCRTGYRGAQLALLAAAQQHGKSSKWVLDRAKILGYNFHIPCYVKLLEEVLDQADNAK